MGQETHLSAGEGLELNIGDLPKLQSQETVEITDSWVTDDNILSQGRVYGTLEKKGRKLTITGDLVTGLVKNNIDQWL